jgi:membrane protease YdiL (CAAX protease family)
MQLTLILAVYLFVGARLEGLPILPDAFSSLASAGLLLALSVTWLRAHPLERLVLHGGGKTNTLVIILAGMLLVNHLMLPVPGYAEPKELGTLLGLIVVVPLAEELFFRGILFDHLQRNLGPLAAWLLSAALFGGLHHANGSVLSGLMLGVLAGGVVLLTGNVAAAVAIHVFFNASILQFDADPITQRHILMVAMVTLLWLYLFGRFVHKGTHESPSSDVVGPAA